MKIIEFDEGQGSQAWLDWRKGLLTATDCPMLLGVSPYATPYQGWQRKTGKIPEQQETEPMRRGKRDEPIAREWFNAHYGLNMKPVCVESEHFPFIGSSLDGISECGRYILEIKSNGAQYHFGLNGGLPDFHNCQMQHQFLSTDKTVEKGFYLSWHNGDPVVKEVYPDEIFLNDYIPKAKKFWEYVIFDEPPALTNKDYRDMSEVSEWYSFAMEYKKICAQIKNLDELKESYRKELIRLCNNESCTGSGVKVLKKFSKGRIDYAKACEELNVHDDMLRHYRKPDSYAWTIMLDQK